jgi:hypothetical protein
MVNLFHIICKFITFIYRFSYLFSVNNAKCQLIHINKLLIASIYVDNLYAYYYIRLHP